MIGDKERRILEYLQSTNATKTSHEIASAIRMPPHEVVPFLIRLRDQHLIDRTGSAWRARVRASSGPLAHQVGSPTIGAPGQYPSPSNLRRGGENKPPGVVVGTSHDSGSRTINPNSRWVDFRKLCLYYASCVRTEERPNLSAFSNQAGDTFIALDIPVNWRTLEAGQRLHISCKDEWTPFIRKHLAKSRYQYFYLGTPVDVLVGTSKDGDDYRLLSPAFVLRVAVALKENMLELQTDPPVEINNGWIERRIPDSGRRREFLDALGIVPAQFKTDDDDEIPSVSGFREAIRALYHARKDWWNEFPDIDRLNADPSIEKIEHTGLHNRAVLMAQPPLKYAKRLVDELQHLAFAATDLDLDRSALVPLFPHQAPPAIAKPPSPVEGSRLATAEYCLLNADQRRACMHAMESQLTVVSGPPGTGKSVVVGHALLNAAIQNKSALFASRNHQAIEAVEPRINAMVEPETLVLRPTRPYGAQAAQFEWYQAMSTLLARPKRPNVDLDRDNAKKKVKDLLIRRDGLESKISELLALRSSLAEAESKCQIALSACPPAWRALLSQPPQMLSRADVERLANSVARLTSSEIRWYVVPFAWLIRRIQAHRCRSAFDSIRKNVSDLVWNSIVGTTAASPVTISTIGHACEQLLGFQALIATIDEREKIESAISRLSDYESLHSGMRDVQRELEMATKRLMKLVAECAGAEISDECREEFARLRAAAKNRPEELGSNAESSEAAKAFRRAMPELMKHFPIWAVSNLSASRAVPLTSAIFDLVIIDEASQCDIASVVPLLFRARRAMIVGDPNQLSHVTRMGRDIEMQLRQRAGVESYEVFERHTFAANSMYDLAASSATRTTVSLRNHYRCHPDIAETCNQLFYNGTLNVMTDAHGLADRLGISRVTRACVWENVPGDAKAAASGSHSPGQAMAIVRDLKKLAQENFRGTVGVVTPFRAQAQRINDLVHQQLPPETLNRWRFLADTVDGFQGDERHLILFSLVGSAGMPAGSSYFLKSTPNRFNVAISRAQALLRVYGDQEWAKGCGIPFVAELLRRCERDFKNPNAPRRDDLIGPVWEPRFATALRDAGLAIEQQYPACGYYLDFAMIGPHGKLNIEIDGEMFHRSPGGGRNIDDIYRDLVLESAGWHVIRFWVYQVREDIHACIERTRAEYDKWCRIGPPG